METGLLPLVAWPAPVQREFLPVLSIDTLARQGPPAVLWLAFLGIPGQQSSAPSSRFDFPLPLFP